MRHLSVVDVVVVRLRMSQKSTDRQLVLMSSCSSRKRELIKFKTQIEAISWQEQKQLHRGSLEKTSAKLPSTLLYDLLLVLVLLLLPRPPPPLTR